MGHLRLFFAVESLMDDMARKLGKDPIAFRLDNIVKRPIDEDFFASMETGVSGQSESFDFLWLHVCRGRGGYPRL